MLSCCRVYPVAHSGMSFPGLSVHFANFDSAEKFAKEKNAGLCPEIAHYHIFSPGEDPVCTLERDKLKQ